MLHPSYSELIDIVNEQAQANGDPEIQSRYSIVIAASKRARQIIDGDEPMTDRAINKALSIAVEEMSEAKVTIVGDTQEDVEEEASEEAVSEDAPAEAAEEAPAEA